MSSCGAPPPGRSRYLGVPRALVNLPAVVGSVAILLVFLTCLGRWEPVAILSWFAIGLAMLTRAAERMAVRIACGFREPKREQLRVLSEPWQDAVSRAGQSPG